MFWLFSWYTQVQIQFRQVFAEKLRKQYISDSTSSEFDIEWTFRRRARTNQRRRRQNRNMTDPQNNPHVNPQNNPNVQDATNDENAQTNPILLAHNRRKKPTYSLVNLLLIIK